MIKALAKNLKRLDKAISQIALNVNFENLQF